MSLKSNAGSERNVVTEPVASLAFRPPFATTAVSAFRAATIGLDANVAQFATAEQSSDQANPKRQAAAARRATLAFGQIAGLVMRSPAHQNLPVADLSWLVVPPVRAGQFLFAGKRERKAGMVTHVSALLWACVSDEIDQKLLRSTTQVRLAPNDWTGGDNIWLIEAIGDPAPVPQMISQLAQTQWKGKSVKVRSRKADGTIGVQTIGPL